MISSIIQKEFIDINSAINIASSKVDNIYFNNYLKKIYPQSTIFSFDNTYYGNMEPSIVICNNRISHLENSIDLCKYFHCPLLVIDHDLKSDLITNKFSNDFAISPVVEIALSQSIHMSWNRVHKYVLEPSEINIPKWKNIIFNVCKQVFQININDNIKNKLYEKKQ